MHPDKGLDWDPCNYSLEIVETFEQFWISLASSGKHNDMISQYKKTSHNMDMDYKPDEAWIKDEKGSKKGIVCL